MAVVAPAGHPGAAAGKGKGKGVSNRNAGNQGFNAPLYDPTQTLSGKPLSQAAHGIANAQIDGPISMLAKQLANNRARGQQAAKDTFGYYQQLGEMAKAGVQADNAQGAQLNSQLSGIGTETQNRIGQLGQQAQGGALGRLGSMGLDGGQQGALQSEMQQQQGVAAQNAGTFRSSGAQQNANYAQNAAGNLGVTSLAGAEGLTSLNRARTLADQPLNTQIAALQAKRGALYSNALGQLRSSERNYQIAEQGIGVKNSAITSAANTATANRNAQGARNAATIAGANARNAATNTTSANNAALSASGQNTRFLAGAIGKVALARAKADAAIGPTGGKPLSTVQNDAKLKDLSVVVNAIPFIRSNGIRDNKNVVTTAHPSESQIRSLLGGQYPAYMIEAAYELLGYGYLTPATASAMHQAGIRGGTFRNAPIRVANPGQAIRTAGVPGGF